MGPPSFSPPSAPSLGSFGEEDGEEEGWDAGAPFTLSELPSIGEVDAAAADASAGDALTVALESGGAAAFGQQERLIARNGKVMILRAHRTTYTNETTRSTSGIYIARNL